MDARFIKITRYVFVCVAMLLLAPAAQPIYAADMTNYCVVPPYVVRSNAPNLMVLLDNSVNMQNPAYTSDYDPTTLSNLSNQYLGYFVPTGCYTYAGGSFNEVLNTSVTPNRSYSASETCPSTAPYRGNLMNWALMSQYDVLQTVLLGGFSKPEQVTPNASSAGSYTLKSAFGGSWVKYYPHNNAGDPSNTCVFTVTGGNLVVSDYSTSSTCPLLDSPPTPLVFWKPSRPQKVLSWFSQLGSRLSAALSDGFKGLLVSASKAWDKVHIVDEAWAGTCTLAISTGSSLNGTVGVPYSLILKESGGTGSANDAWSITYGTPSASTWLSGPTLSGNHNAQATWTGTPTAAGNYPFTATLSNSCGSPVTYSGTISITPAPLIIDTTALPSGNVAVSYSFTMNGHGGTAPLHWSATGLAPTGLTIDSSTGLIYGTPTTNSGSPYSVTVTLTDSGSQSASKTYSLTISASSLAITTTSPLPATNENDLYSFTMAGSGGRGASYYTWSATGLPSGLLMSSSGVISGTVGGGSQGIYSVVVTLSDGFSTVTQTLSFTVYTPGTSLAISTTSLPSAAKGVSYSYTVVASGGSTPFTWSATGLPTGFSINSTTGTITGTATASQVGTYSVTVTVTDSQPRTATATFSFTVVRALSLRSSSNMNVWVQRTEEALIDLNGNNVWDSGETCGLCTSGSTIWCSACDSNGNNVWDGKQGVFQQFWDANNPRANWGLTQFGTQGSSTIVSTGPCIPASPASSFYTGMQNVGTNPASPLAAGLYGDINYFAFNSANFSAYDSNAYKGCNNSDPVDAVPCRKNFVLIITNGSDVSSGSPANGPFAANAAGTTCNYSDPLVQNACVGFNADLRSDKPSKQNVDTYIVNTGDPNGANASVLQAAANAGGGKYYAVTAGTNLAGQLQTALKDILGRAASGTAASVLASGEGSGANLIQAVYYPTKQFGLDTINWIGRLTNLWYFVDPNLNNSNIREDNGALNADGTYQPGDKVLTLQTQNSGPNDNIVQLFFDTTAELTKAHRWSDPTGNAIALPANQLPDVDFESIGNLWEAGGLLWGRDLTASPRVIYTTIGSGLIPFTTANETTLQPYLQAASVAESESIIRYMNGEDTPFSPAITGFTSTYRTRSVSYDSTGVKKTWKLGDIVNSTPKLSSWLPLNNYNGLYSDSTYGVPGQTPSLLNTADPAHFITSANYQSRGMVFAGANDGMLHAFKLGSLELKWDMQGAFDKAQLAGTNLGTEAWAFVPKNALPYLKYIADQSYCHLYTVDMTPVIFDASIGTPSGCSETDTTKCVRAVDSWRTIVIGGMRYGGACKKTCVDSDCVSTPTTDPADNTNATGLGYSSYFALDITDQNNPVLLWEFSSEQLGFSTSGPSILRESAKVTVGGVTTTHPEMNGSWFVVFGSGPTGPISTTDSQFLAHSDQPLRLFVLDLKNGPTSPVTVIETFADGTSLPSNAFSGSLLNSSMDTDLDYSDDVMYIPYVKKCTSPSGTAGIDCTANTWTDGGVLRLSTNQDTDPGNWKVSTLMDGIGPVTASVTKLQNRTTNTLWIYFGAGRYFYSQGGVADDAVNQRQIFGIKEPCLSSTTGLFLPACTTSVLDSSLTDVTNIANVPSNPDSTSFNGWYIKLDPDLTTNGATDATVHAERVITDPVATTSGVVFFTTYKPYTDQCALGGTSAIWALKYNTGGDASSLLKGQALIQVSTGAIQQLKLSDAFKDSVTGLNTGNRKSAAMQGVPPMAQGLSIIGSPPPTKKVVHIKER